MGKGNLHVLIILLIGLMFSSCATTQDLSTDVRTQTFEADYNQTFKAVVQSLSNDGFAIDNADSETGIINTDYSNASSLEAFFTGDERTKVNAILSEGGDNTEVRLTISVQEKSALTGWRSATMTSSQAENYYQELFSKIEGQL